MALPPPGQSDEVQRLLYLLAEGERTLQLWLPVLSTTTVPIDVSSEVQKLCFALTQTSLAP